MEWAVWVASSDSEDDLTPEKDEEGAPSNTGQQCSLNDTALESSTSNAQGAMDLASVNEAAANRNGWDSRDPVKAKAGEKPPPKDIQGLMQFRKKDGSKVPVSRGMRSTLTVSVSEEAGVSYKESEDLAMSEEEQKLVMEEDLWEPAEELQCKILTSEFGVGWNQNPRSFAVQRKKRHFTEDGLGQASKLAKKTEQPQKSQMPCESAECGESSSDPAHRQWSPSLQGGQLEESYAAEEPINCTQSTESSSPSSQEVQTGELKHSSPEFNRTYSNASPLNQHVSIQYIDGSKCPECKKWFAQADGMTQHRLMRHNIEAVYQCSECNTAFNSLSRLHKHWKVAHGPLDPFKCAECSREFLNEDDLVRHRVGIHSRQRLLKCSVCDLTFTCYSCLKDHQFSSHKTNDKYTCVECKKHFSKLTAMIRHRFAIHNPKNCLHCSVCEFTFSSPSRLKRHKLLVHCPKDHPIAIHDAEKPSTAQTAT